MQAVIDYLKQNQSRFVDQLCEYVRFPSVSAQPQHRQDLQACAQWVVNHCQGIGLETRLCTTQGNPVVVAKTPHKPPADRKSEVGSQRSEIGRALRPLTSALRPPPSTRRPHFVVYGHYDVQPPEPFELWKSPPFEPRIEGGALFAR